MILEKIIKHKEKELSLKKNSHRFLKTLQKKEISLIAEIKKSSPSKGILKKNFDPLKLASTYEKYGAKAISVLTDEKFFQGSLKDLQKVRAKTNLPLLRKDFIIHESQIYEAFFAGADAILLITAILTLKKLDYFLTICQDLGIDALVEVHSKKDCQKALKSKAKIIGINNRNLKNFKVDLNQTLTLVKSFPKLTKKILVSESGIKSKDDVLKLKDIGVKAILVGESILKSKNISKKIKELSLTL